jgi:hypothetical protein
MVKVTEGCASADLAAESARTGRKITHAMRNALDMFYLSSQKNHSEASPQTSAHRQY